MFTYNMKNIKTENYLRKQSQINNLPGDINLPPGVTDNDINQRMDSSETISYYDQKGEIDVVTEQGKDINLNYTYDAEFYPDDHSVEIYNINITKKQVSWVFFY